MTLEVSQYMWYLWILTKGSKDVMPFPLPTTKAYVEFIGREKTRAYLQCIYCKVKQWIHREMSHTMMCMCVEYRVDIYGG